MTQKQLIQLEKDEKFEIFAIDKDDTRGTWCSNYSLIAAFSYVIHQLRIGTRIVVMTKKDVDFMIEKEYEGDAAGFITESQMDHGFYENALKYASNPLAKYN